MLCRRMLFSLKRKFDEIFETKKGAGVATVDQVPLALTSRCAADKKMPATRKRERNIGSHAPENHRLPDGTAPAGACPALSLTARS